MTTEYKWRFEFLQVVKVNNRRGEIHGREWVPGPTITGDERYHVRLLNDDGSPGDIVKVHWSEIQGASR